MLNPVTFLREAVRAVPAIRYALGVGGIVATIAIIFAFEIAPKIAFVGTVVMLLLMAVLVIFARTVSLAGPRTLLPALVLTWFSLLIFIAVSLALFSSVFFQKPLDLAHWLDDRPPNKPTFDEQGALNAIELGVDLSHVLEKLGQPTNTSIEPGGFRLARYSYPSYNLTIVYDRARRIMQYGVYVKDSSFKPEIMQLRSIIGRRVRVGELPFAAMGSEHFNPIYLSPLASDSEPFEYYELLSDTPETDIAIRLEYIVSRRNIPRSVIESSEAMDELAATIQELGCSYEVRIGGGIFTKDQFRILEKLRNITSPNAYTVQRRLEESEVKPFTEHIASYRLCDKQ